MFDAFELRTTPEEVKRSTGAVTAAWVVMGLGIVALGVLGNRPIAATPKPSTAGEPAAPASSQAAGAAAVETAPNYPPATGWTAFPVN